MKKSVTIQALIIGVTLAIVLPVVAFSEFNQTSITAKNQQITEPFKAIVFKLQRDQTVSGSATTDVSDAFFMILDSNGHELEARYILAYSNPQPNNATFKFIAPVSGIYYIALGSHYGWTEHIDYSYRVSPPPILGFDPLTLAAAIVAIAVVLTLINAFFYFRARKKILR